MFVPINFDKHLWKKPLGAENLLRAEDSLSSRLHLMDSRKNNDESYPPIERLELLFRRPPELTALPASMNLLSRQAEAGADPSQLEMIIASDPGLAARFLKLNGEFDAHTARRSLDVGHSIRARGHQAIKSFVSASVIGGFVGEKANAAELEPFRFARHCLFVGAFCARYAETFPSEAFTPAEALTVGVLHDVGLLILAATAPLALSHVCDFSKQCGVTFDVSFSCVYPRSLSSLASTSVEVWRLDDKLAQALTHFDGAEVDTSQELAYVSRLGDWLAGENGFAWETWSASAALPPAVAAAYEENRLTFDGLAREAAMMANEGLIALAKGRSSYQNAA
jgi:HD-like signal output (HDOD) protein